MGGEGYVKYTAEHKNAAARQYSLWEELNNARSRLRLLNLIGITPAGIGFGNLSIRTNGDEFLITGTATGAAKELGPDGYCLVRSFDLEKNSVITEGPVKASSESMTHGAIYRACPAANCVIHIHSRPIFDAMLRDTFPSTPPDAEYGTPEIALAICKLVESMKSSEGTIVLAGHDEGVIAFGPTIETALKLILDLNSRFT